jgi:hypothetical protein
MMDSPHFVFALLFLFVVASDLFASPRVAVVEG